MRGGGSDLVETLLKFRTIELYPSTRSTMCSHHSRSLGSLSNTRTTSKTPRPLLALFSPQISGPPPFSTGTAVATGRPICTPGGGACAGGAKQQTFCLLQQQTMLTMRATRPPMPSNSGTMRKARKPRKAFPPSSSSSGDAGAGLVGGAGGGEGAVAVIAIFWSALQWPETSQMK